MYWQNEGRGLAGTAEGTVAVACTKSCLAPYELGVVDEAKHIFAASAAARTNAAFGPYDDNEYMYPDDDEPKCYPGLM